MDLISSTIGIWSIDLIVIISVVLSNAIRFKSISYGYFLFSLFILCMLIIKGLKTKHSKKLLNINCFSADSTLKIDIDWE